MIRSQVALLFPGQGSQSVGMLARLADAHAVIEQTFAEASDLLGYDLWLLAQNGPEETQRRTEFTQPLMYVSGISLWRLWSQLAEVDPVVMAGHSLGEFCALTAAGAIDFASGVALVRTRARLMADAVPAGEGGMAAILGMDDAAIDAVCRDVTGERVVEAVNYNAPGQVVISGHIDALERAAQLARERGARKAIILPVSVPNHSSLMRAAGDELARQIDHYTWQIPRIPVMQNAAAAVAGTMEELMTSLKKHVYSPVYWTHSYRNLLEQYQPAIIVELGPGGVLAGLGKRIDKSKRVFAVDSPDTLASALASVHGDGES